MLDTGLISKREPDRDGLGKTKDPDQAKIQSRLVFIYIYYRRAKRVCGGCKEVENAE